MSKIDHLATMLAEQLTKDELEALTTYGIGDQRLDRFRGSVEEALQRRPSDVEILDLVNHMMDVLNGGSKRRTDDAT